jgi:hypothetical protein
MGFATKARNFKELVPPRPTRAIGGKPPRLLTVVVLCCLNLILAVLNLWMHQPVLAVFCLTVSLATFFARWSPLEEEKHRLARVFD